MRADEFRREETNRPGIQTESVEIDRAQDAKSKDKARGCWRVLKKHSETGLIILGVMAGIGVGLGLRVIFTKEGRLTLTPRQVSYIGFPGELFLSMLKGLTIPLVMSSIISAVGSMDVRLMGKMGAKAVVYYTVTMTLAMTLAIVLSITVQPGRRMVEETNKGDLEFNNTNKVGEEVPNFEKSLTQDSLMDILRQMFPPNLVQATMNTYKTKLELPPGQDPATFPLEKYTMAEEFVPGVNILGLLTFSVALGMSLAILGQQGAILLGFIRNLLDAVMIITGWAIWLSPGGIFFLLAAETLRVDDFGAVALSLGIYLITTLASYLIHTCITLPLIYVIVVRKMPFRFMSRMVPAFVMGAGTSSTIAILPLTLKCLEKNRVNPRVTRFILPIGATLNVDGMALYEGAAVLFIAQLDGVNLSIGQTIALCLTATIASIGSAATVQSGLVLVVMVLNSYGLPVSYISLIFPIDWILDRLRTCVNTMGDSFGAAIIDHLNKGALDKLDNLQGVEEHELGIGHEEGEEVGANVPFLLSDTQSQDVPDIMKKHFEIA